MQRPDAIRPEQYAAFIARCDAYAPRPASVGTPSAATPTAVTRSAPALAATPPIAAPEGPTSAICFTSFANDDGPLTKRISLDANGELQGTASAYLVRGSYSTLTINGINDLKPLIAELRSNEALAWGVSTTAPTGRIATSKAIKEGRAPAGAIPRSSKTFAWSDGPGVLMIDVDQKDAPDALRADSAAEVRTRLIEVCPELAGAPVLMIPSAGACIYDDATDECLRGLTGVRGYILVERAAEIAEIGRRLRDRLVLAGHGFAFSSKAGTIHVRTTIDDSVWLPERLDFVGGALCDDGLSQRRGEPETWNSTAAPLRRNQVPPLSDGEIAKVREIEASIKAGAVARALEARALWEAAQRAAGRTVSVSWRPDCSVEFLRGEHEVLLTDGTWVTIDTILGDPARYHEATCADPVEPDYRGDTRIAKIYSAQATPIIRSNAHGGVNYVLMASAREEFSAAGAADGPTFATEHEELASLLGDPDRVIDIALPTLAEGADVSATIEEIVRAASVLHPLRAVFEDEVLPQAKSLLSLLSNEPAFVRFLRSQLGKEDQWKGLGSAAQRVLIRGAYVMLAPYDRLVGDAMRQPKLIADTGGARTFLVDPAIPDGSMLGIIGPAGSGKSTTARALAWYVGQPPSAELLTERTVAPKFEKLPVSHGTALYFCSEDIAGVEAARRKMAAAYDPSAHAHFIDGVPLLSSTSATVSYVRRTLHLLPPGSPPVRLIIIDLFRDTFQGNENDSGDVGAAMAAAYALSRVFKSTVGIVHHSALADEARARGSGAFVGKLDVCAAVAMRDGSITWTFTKARHEARGRVLRWHLDTAGVLRAGVGAGAATGGSVKEECARVIARVVHDLATEESPIGSREIKATLATEHPQLFGAALPPDTVKSRISRGKAHARSLGWTKERGTKLAPGAVRPPEDESSDLSQSPADLVWGL